MSIKLPSETKHIEILPADSSGTVIADITMSKYVANILMDVYPGYSWLVRADHERGVCLIRCGEISANLNTQLLPSMVMHIKNMTDPSITRKKVIQLGGELLERASLTRGRWSGDYPTHLDGLADRHQPQKAAPQPSIRIIIDAKN